jgi:hypothetical protein
MAIHKQPACLSNSHTFRGYGGQCDPCTPNCLREPHVHAAFPDAGGDCSNLAVVVQADDRFIAAGSGKLVCSNKYRYRHRDRSKRNDPASCSIDWFMAAGYACPPEEYFLYLLATVPAACHFARNSLSCLRCRTAALVPVR